MSFKASALVEASRAYKGTPFRHQGRSSNGIDCLGLWAMSLRDLGVSTNDPCDYGRSPDIRRLIRETDAQAIRLPKETPLQAGLLAIFHDTSWVHVGIMTGPESFIHARGPEFLKIGVIEHRLDEQSWRPRLKALWRHPEMEWPG